MTISKAQVLSQFPAPYAWTAAEVTAGTSQTLYWECAG